MQTASIPIQLIDPDPDQPRKHFAPEKLAELAGSLSSEGLLQPISVRAMADRYRIIAGERRFRAAQSLGWQQIAANVFDVDDNAAARLQLLENLVRADLDPVEEARAMQRLLDVGMTSQELADALGTVPAWITLKVGMLRAREDVLHLVSHGQLSPTAAWHIGRLSPHGQGKALQILTSRELPFDAQIAVFERIYQAECQGEMFSEAKLSPEEVRAAKGFRSAIERAMETFGELQAIEEKNRGIISRAVATELDGAQFKLRELKRQIGLLERALTSEQARLLVEEVA